MLKEFDLDAPSLPKAERIAFSDQTRFVCALFERHFASFKETGSIWKLLIEVVPPPTRPLPINSLNVLLVQVAGDPQGFFALTEKEKSEATLRWLIAGATLTAEACKWPLRPFIQAADAVLKLDFINVWIWKKLVNKAKTLSTEILVVHEMKTAQIVARFRDRNQTVIAEVTLIQTKPSEFIFVPCLGRLKWLDNATVRLSAKNGAESWEAHAPVDPISGKVTGQ